MSDEIVKVIDSKKCQERLNNYRKVEPLYEQPDIKPVSYTDLVNSNPDPMQFILHPWLPMQGIAFVYAEAGVGKTLFTLNVAYAIAQGGNFLTFKAEKPRKVLYVDGEMAYNQLHSRFMNVVKEQDILDSPENWHLLTPDKVAPQILPKICDVVGQQFYNDLIDEYKIEVIIFDNLSSLAVMDESDPVQWKIIQDWLIHLRTKKISTIIVHHAGKDKKGYRGTSRMLDIVDTAISLQKISQDQLENEKSDLTRFKVEYHKNRSFGGKDAYPFEVSLSISGWDFSSLEKTNLVRIADSLNEGVRKFVIAREMGVSASYVSKMSKLAKKHGMLNDK